MAEFRRGAVALTYQLSGEAGDPVALIHGSWCDHQCWDLLVARIDRATRVLAYDRRAPGGDSAAIGRVRQDADDLAALLEETDEHPVHVVGHSYGGAVAIRLAIDRPELVRSVAVHEPPFLGLLGRGGPHAADVARVEAEVARLRALVRAGEYERAGQGLIALMEPAPGNPVTPRLPPRAALPAYALGWAEEIGDPDATSPDRGPLRRIDLPALVTVGERSMPLLAQASEELARALPNCTLRVVPEAGHWPHLTHVETYAGILLSYWLERDVPVT